MKSSPEVKPPMRLVSLVPSLTHMLCDFGLREALVGVTQFCIAPAGLHRQAALCGGTKNPDLAAISALKPTHILVNSEENKPEHIAACQKIAPTFVSFPKNPADVVAMLRDVGVWLGVEPVGESFAVALEGALGRLKDALRPRAESPQRRRRYLYLIWREPYMLAGRDTYIEAMLALLGWENAALPGNRYPEISVAAMQAAAPDLLLLSSEPYPFRTRDADRLRESWPDAPAILKADGQLLSWYGTMTQTAIEALTAWCASGQEGILAPFHRRDGEASALVT